MNYEIVYEPDYGRFLPAIIIDCRADIPEIKNQIGNVIKNYTDSKVSLIKDNCIFYKIESELGNVAGVFAISVNEENKTATLLIQYIRPSFKKNKWLISDIVVNFIASNVWVKDYLF